MKTLWLLIGPKGAGKTHIGTVIDQHTDVHFLPVEPLWVNHLQQGGLAENGWQVVIEAIAAAFQTYDPVIIETLGAGGGFDLFHQSLRRRYRLKYIHVQADPEVCLERVQTRDGADQIPVSLEQVQYYNAIAAQVSYPWDAVIMNTPPLSEAEILAAVQSLL